jgi:hypothetical protein
MPFSEQHTSNEARRQTEHRHVGLPAGMDAFDRAAVLRSRAVHSTPERRSYFHRRLLDLSPQV